MTFKVGDIVQRRPQDFMDYWWQTSIQGKNHSVYDTYVVKKVKNFEGILLTHCRTGETLSGAAAAEKFMYAQQEFKEEDWL